MAKRLIYTVLTSDKDTLKDPLVITPGAEYVCLTDDPNLKSSIWNIYLIPPVSVDARKLSRFHKILQDDGYDQTLYIDASFEITRDLTPLLERKTEGVWAIPHPQRGCAYKEAKVVLDKKLDDPEVVNRQVDRYRAEGFPEYWGLWRCGILIRDSRNAKFDETWWKEVRDNSWRDQISFPYACWKVGIRPKPIMFEIVDHYFEQSLHKTYPTEDWKHVGDGQYDSELVEKYPLAHLIIKDSELYFPKWVNNYVTLKFGTRAFVHSVKQLGGTVVYG